MVHLLTLKIQGIRSIGNEPHSIDFLQPLTLIQGPNGTGKTTIIEALNFVTSGTQPPGKAASFIHDPKASNASRVDALVQLQFTDVKDNNFTVTNRMTSYLGKSGAGIESTKSKKDESTLVDSFDNKMSSKNCDVVHETLSRLGVNQAILKYVIFCHQEESNWPLSEPKKLQERFNEIFEVSDYAKIGDDINKERKSLDKKVAEIEIEIQNHLTGYVNNSNNLHREIASKIQIFEKNLIKLDELNNLKVTLENKLIQWNLKKLRIDELKSAIEIKKAIVKNKEDNLKSIDVVVVQENAGTLDELKKEWDDALNSEEFQNEIKENEKIASQSAKISIDLAKINEEIIKIQNQINKFEVKRQRKEEIEQDKNNLIADIKIFYELVAVDDKVEEKLEKIMEENEEQLKQFLEENKIKIDQFNQELNEANINVANNEATKRSKESDIHRIQNEIKAIGENINQINDSLETRNILETQILNLENELAEEETLQSIKKALVSKDLSLNLAKNEIEEFLKVIYAENEFQQKCKELEIVMVKNQEELAKIFSPPINENFNQHLTTKKFDLEKNLKIAENIYFQRQKELTEIMDKLKYFQIQNKFNEKEIKESQEKINFQQQQNGFFVINFDDFQKVKEKLEQIQIQLKNYRNEIGEKQGSRYLFEKWEKEIATINQCPLCEKSCENLNDVEKLISKVQKSSMNLPMEIQKLTESLKKCEIQERNLTQILPLIEKIETLLNQNATNFVEIQKIEEQKAAKESEKFAVEKELKNIRENLNIVRNLLEDAKLMDKFMEDKNNAKIKIENARKELTDFSKIEWNLNQFKEAKEKTEAKIELLKVEIKAMENKHDQVQENSDKLFKLKEEKFKFEGKASEIKLLIKSKEEKQKCLNQIQDEIIKIDVTELPSSKLKQQKLKNEMEKIRVNFETKKNEIEKIIKKCEQNLESFKSANFRLVNLEFDENEKFQLISNMNLQNERKIKLEQQKNELENFKMISVKKQQKIRNLKEQLNAKTLQNDIQELNYQIKCHQNEYDALKNNEQKAIKCQENLNVCNREIQTIKIDQKHHQEFIQTAKKQLNEPNIKNAVKNYGNKYTEKCLSEVASKDLGTYMKSLDEAIITFHKIKMEKVNIILSELWETIYDGNDIQTIRIKSDPFTGTDKRQKYNYSVVMKLFNNGNELEMRDRCSAGQKVLASILIRIALAEVFAINCPILALDEPTTNLDNNKIENLSNKLAKLLDERQNHLQLIVITHDEQLFRSLYQSCRPEFVYSLSKNFDGVSQLKRHNKIDDASSQENEM